MRNPFDKTSDYFNNLNVKSLYKNGNKNGKW